jgi:D-alanyl-D-alanine carboxypeptidase
MKKISFYLPYLFLILLFFFVGMVIKKNLDSFFFNMYYEPPVLGYRAEIKPFSIELEEETEPEEKESFLDVHSAISVRISEGKKDVLFEKNANTSFPIASITKLMTAWVVLEHPEYFVLSQSVPISKEALKKYGNNHLEEGSQIILNDLLHAMLIHSNNSSAYAIAESFNIKDQELKPEERLNSFIQLMNFESEKLGLKNTYFFNCTGLDEIGINRSSSHDLITLAENILEKHPEIFEITAKSYYPISNNEGETVYVAYNRNELLGKVNYLFGGKTGWTLRAGGCILLVQEFGESDYLISIVLGANSPQERFTEVKKMIQFIGY